MAMAVIFAVISIASMYNFNTNGEILKPISNSPGLCFDEHTDADGTITTENENVCLTNGERTTDSQDMTLFLYDKLVMLQAMASLRAGYIVMSIGTMLSIASFLGGIIYWNHNKIK